VPGKLFEYIGSKRPILCVGTKKGDAARIITETKAGKVFDYDEKELLKNYLLNAFGKFKSKELKVESEDFLRFSRKELAEKVASTLDEISR
jgi:hypothetical protein